MTDEPKPEGLDDAHLEYLDELRESGKTNMFGARPYLQANFRDLGDNQAGAILAYWMKTFNIRHPAR